MLSTAPTYIPVRVLEEESLPRATSYSSSKPDLESKPLPTRPRWERSVFNYKPIILRTTSLVTCLLITLSCIGLLELAVQKLPHALPTRKAAMTESQIASLNARQIDGSSVALQTTSESSAVDILPSSSSTSLLSSTTLTHTSSATARPAPWLPPAPAPAPLPNFLETDYTRSLSATLLSVPQPTPMPTPGNHISTEHSSTFTSPPASAQSDNYVSTDGTTYSAPDTTRILGSSAVAGASIPADQTKTLTRPVDVYFAPHTVYVPTDTTVMPISTPIPGSGDADDTETRVTTSTSATVLWIPVKQSPQETTILRTIATGGSTTIQAIKSTITPSPKSTQLTSLVVVTTTSLPVTVRPGSESRVVVYKWTNVDVFAGMYLAVLIAIFYHIVWRLIFNNLTLIEPFRQMATPEGALADHTLFTFYLSQSSLFGLIPAIVHRRWMLAAVATTYSIAGFLPGLAVETIFTDTNWQCDGPDPKQIDNPCPARISAHIIIIRLIEGLLAFAAFVLCALITCLLRSSTGLPANPSSMATVASLIGNPDLHDDFHSLPVNASTDEMRKQLQGRRYRLNYYKTTSEDIDYGIVPHTHESQKQEYGPVSPTSKVTHKNHRAWINDSILILLVLGLFGVILGYYLDWTDSSFNNWFSSDTFGPKFLLTTTASLIASIWTSVQQSTLTMAPYTRLATSSAPSPPHSTLLYTPSNTPLLATYRTFQNRYFFAAFLTLVALLGEVLTVSVAAVAYTTGQTWTQYSTSVYLSIAVLSIMIVAMALVMLRRRRGRGRGRRREPKMPRNPDTLGPVMGYLVGSEVIRGDFEGLSLMGQRERDEVVCGMGRRYVFEDDGRGWRVDVVKGQV